MLVSYVITVKNGCSFIEATLISVLNQTYKHIEIIVVDDGSTDNTLELLYGFGDKLNVIPTTGVGRSKALNIGIKAAKGVYICILDADDLIHSSKTELQIKALQKCTENNIIIFTEFEVFSSDKNLIIDRQISNHSYTMIDRNTLFYKNPFCHSSMMIRRELLINLKCYNNNLKKLVDYDLYIRSVKAGVSFLRINKKLTFKRFHDAQSFESKNRGAYILSILKMQFGYVIKERKFQYLPLVLMKLIYSVLPAKIRLHLKNRL